LEKDINKILTLFLCLESDEDLETTEYYIVTKWFTNHLILVFLLIPK